MTAATLATTAASCIAVSAASAALVDFSKCQYQIVKQKLLEDKTTGRRFIDGVNDICTRVEKSREDQSKRTKKKGEVFTPSWLCKKMNDFIWAEIEGDFLTQSRRVAKAQRTQRVGRRLSIQGFWKLLAEKRLTSFRDMMPQQVR